MSVTGISSSDHNKFHTNSFHWRNNSGELDVFEAAQYFSSVDENQGYNINGADLVQQMIQRATRMSLDVPNRNPIPPQNNVMEKQVNKENKKLYKQPSSPGGRLGSFLNSLLNQTHLKKKKKSKSGGENDLDQEERTGTWRRKRRRSISHFNFTNSSKFGGADSKSVYSSSSSGFTTPIPYANTPMKWYKEFRSFTDHQNQMISVPKKSVGFTASSLKSDVKIGSNCATIGKGVLEKDSKNGSFGFSIDDGADSDSSSDLFDLPNHDLDFYSTGLPVYETTRMDSIRRGPIVVVIP